MNNKNQKIQKPKMSKGPLLRLIKKIWLTSKIGCIFILVMSVASSVISVIAISYVSKLFDVYIPLIIEATKGGVESSIQSAYQSFYRFIILWSSLFLFSALTSFSTSFTIISISQKVMRNLRHETFSKMQYLPISFFDQNKFGDVMSRYTNDIDTLDNFITQTVPNFISSFIMIIAILVMMFINNWLLTFLVLVLMVIVILSTKPIMKGSAKHYVGRQKLVGVTNAYVEEMMSGAKVVQVFNHQEIGISEFESINEKFRVEDEKAVAYGNVMAPVMGNLVRIMFVLTAIIGSIYVIKNPNYTVGLLVSFLTFTNMFGNPIGRMSQQVNSIAQANAGSARVFEIIDHEEEVDEGYVTLVNYIKDEAGNILETTAHNHNWAWKHPHQTDGTITYTPLKGDIVFENVDFSYEKDKQVLFDISLYARPGERVALVGETGAGKTTITNLINRFYDIEDGKIRYDGININKIKKQDLRRSLGLVLQETNLFTMSIKDNIKLGKPGASDEEVVGAAKIANADSFIRMMPNGYDTILSRAGENLSQGQRQLIAIARAAIADCPVLILDEATSSIDTRTESIIQKGMDSLMEGRTVFVIAHRLSTVEKSNVIMVMDHGRIIERGNHEELIAKHGVYFELYTGKFEME